MCAVYAIDSWLDFFFDQPGLMIKSESFHVFLSFFLTYLHGMAVHE